VVVSAPLRLTNQLPVGGSLLVWEQQPGVGRELVGRQTVQVASGATVPIHTGGNALECRLGLDDGGCGSSDRMEWGGRAHAVWRLKSALHASPLASTWDTAAIQLQLLLGSSAEHMFPRVPPSLPMYP